MEPSVTHDAGTNSVWMTENNIESEVCLDDVLDPLAAKVEPKVEPCFVKEEPGLTSGRDRISSMNEKEIDGIHTFVSVKEEPTSPSRIPSPVFSFFNANSEIFSEDLSAESPTKDPLEMKPHIGWENRNDRKPILVNSEHLAAKYQLKQCFVPLIRCMSSTDLVSSQSSKESPTRPPTRKESKCYICNKRYSSKWHFNKHNLLQHGPPFGCLRCNKVFSLKIYVDHHRKSHRKEYKCDICGKIVGSTAYLRDHLVVHSDNPPTCPTCEKVFAREKNLKKHLLTNHKDLAKSFQCTSCDKSFLTHLTLGTHMKTHVKPFKCTLCDKTFSSKQLCNAHLVVHSGKKDHKCDICGKSFALRRVLKAHRDGHLAGSFDCGHCEKKYKSKIALQRHILSYHAKNGRETFPCSICKKPLLTENNLLSHMKLHKSQRCKVCDEVCSDVTALRIHMTVAHGGSKKHRCKACGVIFMTAEELEEHEKLHSERDLKCPSCPKTFSDAFKYKAHLHYHGLAKKISEKYSTRNKELDERQDEDQPAKYRPPTPLKKIKNGEYPCRFCKKIFGNIKILRSHQKIHVKQYKCDKCPKTFGVKAQLRFHLDDHETTKKYSCAVCNKSFQRLITLRRHKNDKHSGKPKCLCFLCKKEFSSKSAIRIHINEQHLL